MFMFYVFTRMEENWKDLKNKQNILTRFSLHDADDPRM